jgi:hypothetical protein
MLCSQKYLILKIKNIKIDFSEHIERVINNSSDMFIGVTDIASAQLETLEDKSSDYIGGVTFNSFDMIGGVSFNSSEVFFNSTNLFLKYLW